MSYFIIAKPNNMLMKTILLVLLLAGSLHASAQNWPNWRGPDQNGISSATGIVDSWSETKNVLWKIPLTDRGGSTPVVWGNRIFLTAAEAGKNTVHAYDKTTGKELWKVHVGKQDPGEHKKGSGANPSAVTDGKHVWAYFKSGDVTCIDVAGKTVWTRNLAKELEGDSYSDDALWWDLGTSPILTKSHLVITVMVSGPSFLLALDPKTGKKAWRAERNLDVNDESNQSYTTPVLAEKDGKEMIFTVGADYITAHDAATGKELWRAGGLNPTNHQYFRLISSPVIAGDLVIAPHARGKNTMAFKMVGEGDVTTSGLVWNKDGGSDVPSPAYQDGKLYFLGDKGYLSCVDAATGEEKWGHQIKKSSKAYSASPVLVDGKIVLLREDGLAIVGQETDSGFEEISQNQLDAATYATPVATDGTLLIRSNGHLYCIGKK